VNRGSGVEGLDLAGAGLGLERHCCWYLDNNNKGIGLAVDCWRAGEWWWFKKTFEFEETT